MELARGGVPDPDSRAARRGAAQRHGEAVAVADDFQYQLDSCMNPSVSLETKVKVLHGLAACMSHPQSLAAVARSGALASLGGLLQSLLPHETSTSIAGTCAAPDASAGLTFWSPAFAACSGSAAAQPPTAAAACPSEVLPPPSAMTLLSEVLLLVHTGLLTALGLGSCSPPSTGTSSATAGPANAPKPSEALATEYVSQVVATAPCIKACLLVLVAATAECDDNDAVVPPTPLPAAAPTATAVKPAAPRLLSSAASALLLRGGSKAPPAPQDEWDFVSGEDEAVVDPPVPAPVAPSDRTRQLVPAALDLLYRGVSLSTAAVPLEDAATAAAPVEAVAAPVARGGGSSSGGDNNSNDPCGDAPVLSLPCAQSYGSVPAAAHAMARSMEAARGVVQQAFGGQGLAALLALAAAGLASPPGSSPLLLPCLALLEELTFGGGGSSTVGTGSNPVAAAIAEWPLETPASPAPQPPLLPLLLRALVSRCHAGGDEGVCLATLRVLVNVCHGSASVATTVVTALREPEPETNSASLSRALAALLTCSPGTSGSSTSHDAAVCALALLVNLAESTPALLYQTVAGSPLWHALLSAFATRYAALGCGGEEAGSEGPGSGSPEDLCIAGYSCILLAWLLHAEDATGGQDDDDPPALRPLRTALGRALGVAVVAAPTASALQAPQASCPVSRALLQVLRAFMSRNSEVGVATDASWAEAEAIEAMLLGQARPAQAAPAAIDASVAASTSAAKLPSASGMAVPSKPWSWASVATCRATAGGAMRQLGLPVNSLASLTALDDPAGCGTPAAASASSTGSAPALVSPSFWDELATLVASSPQLEARHAAGPSAPSTPMPAARRTGAGFDAHSTRSSLLSTPSSPAAPSSSLSSSSSSQRGDGSGARKRRGSPEEAAAAAVPCAKRARLQVSPSSAASSLVSCASTVTSATDSSGGSAPRTMQGPPSPVAPVHPTSAVVHSLLKPRLPRQDAAAGDPFGWGAEDEAVTPLRPAPALGAASSGVAASRPASSPVFDIAAPSAYGRAAGLASARLVQSRATLPAAAAPWEAGAGGRPPHSTSGPSERTASRWLSF